MTTFDEHNATEAVLERIQACPDPRLREIMASVVAHLHQVVRETEPTLPEWMAAIRFLTRTGQMCDDKRQEFILLSDVLGVSMLVDAINNRKPSGATESTVLGPFYVPGAPELPLGADICKDGKGEALLVSGRVLDRQRRPVPGALLDVWQTSPSGFYDIQDPGQPEMNLRGLFTADGDGRYWFRSVVPTSYPVPTDGPVGELLTALGRHPMRPAHIHFIVGAEGFEPVTTHMFVAGDPYLDSDAVFGVKESLVVDFRKVDDPDRAAACGLSNPFRHAARDWVLAAKA